MAIVVGLVGVVLPILPGALLILGAIAVWAILEGTGTGWAVFAAAAVLLVVSGVVKYTWPGRRMRDAGVPKRSLVAGALLGIVGFFVIPVVGLLIGFLLGTYLAEVHRHRTHSDAWQFDRARDEGRRVVDPGGTARRAAGGRDLAGRSDIRVGGPGRFQPAFTRRALTAAGASGTTIWTLGPWRQNPATAKEYPCPRLICPTCSARCPPSSASSTARRPDGWIVEVVMLHPASRVGRSGLCRHLGVAAEARSVCRPGQVSRYQARALPPRTASRSSPTASATISRGPRPRRPPGPGPGQVGAEHQRLGVHGVDAAQRVAHVVDGGPAEAGGLHPDAPRSTRLSR